MTPKSAARFSRAVIQFVAAMALCGPIVRAQGAVGTIRGTVAVPAIVLPQSRSAPVRYGDVPSSEEKERVKKPSPPEVTNVVVYLEGTGLARVARHTTPAVLDQRDATFIPHVLPILKGATVKIVNRDKTYHNVFSLSPIKEFNIGRRPTGEEVPVTFDKTGVVPVFCDIHSHMSAFIVVLGNSFFVQPNSDGSYELDEVPPGKYTIQAWHERFTAPPQTITVTAGDTSTAHFVLQ